MVAKTGAFSLHRAGHIDWSLLFIVLAFLILGLVMVYSASYGFALFETSPAYGQPTYFVKRQALFAGLGLVGLFFTSRLDYHWYQKRALLILGFTMATLVGMMFFGQEVGGARRWLSKGGSIQPSEFAVLGAIIYISVWLASKGEEIRNIHLGLIPFSLILGLMTALIMLQPNFSTAILLAATAIAIFFAAGADIRQLLILLLFGSLVLPLVALVAHYPLGRLRLWLQGPFSAAYAEGFQLVQSLAALNKGGWFGVGLGQSQQKFILYAPHSDAILAIIGEELGLVGSLFVLALYGLWTWRGLRIALQAPDTYGMLLAVGIVCWITFQAILHVAVITASTPFTGNVLPFISAGGSSLISCLAGAGILLNISRQAKFRPQEGAQ
jgi:cell division protein FtsW